MRVPNAIRRVTDPVLERIPVPVVSGVNRGRWWNLASAGSGYASGRRAAAQLRLMGALMKPGDVVWDVGAHHGFVTLFAADAVGPDGRVHAFEPGARSARILERHLRWNRVGNARAHAIALGAFEGEARFGGGGTSRTNAVGRGPERVTVRTGASVVRDGWAPAPDVVKIDVEGGEAEVLRGALGILPGTARLVIAVHGADADRACTALLREHGYATHATPPLDRVRAGAWRGDPDLICTGPEYVGPPIPELMLSCHPGS
jgi:FkbM family methyltransferase